jgi:hypothetical protein
MGNIRTPLPVKLFFGVLTSMPEILPIVEERIAGLFGDVDSRSVLFPFDLTQYYNKSMGTPIYRCFIGFSDLMAPSAIAGVKIKANEMEAAFAQEYRKAPRPVNLDPGYLEQSKIVLASTKNFYHRILISQGIYAEVTLHFEKGEWRSFPWTFPDFKTDRYHSYFMSLRELYRNQLKTRLPIAHE